MSAPGQYEFLVALIVAVIALELLSRRLRLPSAAAFILGGLLLAVVPGIPTFSMDPDLVLLVFLPPLLMNGGYQTAWAEFRENITGITLLAVVAVVVTTLVVGLVTHQVSPHLPWAVCFALGAIASPPDAVAAGAILLSLNLPGRLTATLEGESLLNDASGLVLLRFAIVAALTSAFNAWSALLQFAWMTAGGIGLGWAAGRAALALLKRLRDSEIAILVTLLLPIAAYILGDRLGVSGVLATVVAGIVVGRSQHAVLSAATRLRAQAFWGVLVFIFESILFILVGLALRDVLARARSLGKGWSWVLPLCAIVAATVIARFARIFAAVALRRLFRSATGRGAAPPSAAVATVLSWAGMRGVVTLAAALSLPQSFLGRDFVLAAAFAVILATVLIQGPTLAPLIRALRLSGAAELLDRRDSADRAWADMTSAQHKAIVELSRQEDGSERHPRLLDQYGLRARLAREFLQNREEHTATKSEHNAAVLAAIGAGRQEVLRLHADGEIHDQVLRDLERELDLQQLVVDGYAS